jgi:hypothetical protein
MDGLMIWGGKQVVFTLLYIKINKFRPIYAYFGYITLKKRPFFNMKVG